MSVGPINDASDHLAFLVHRALTSAGFIFRFRIDIDCEHGDAERGLFGNRCNRRRDLQHTWSHTIPTNTLR
ncbi:uncharacterized protein N7506_005782 [Penicillium brevicompactum]|uniref:uncharacterized protein n=1 Tax=Penicillium brevicompactum TaxID=5074 RepID=UPI002541C63B|nr:uncharacterized protein N7506_005782 [Penicillium brevicompactum]KAJ5335846.1 hypothetical protein N7506_005782 [Penicillium brevicompactum]